METDAGHRAGTGHRYAVARHRRTGRRQAPGRRRLHGDPDPPAPAAGLTACASRSHAIYSDLDIWFRNNDLTVADRIQAGSSLKFCLIAEGKADIYPRFGPTCEWDTAAAHAVLAAAGGEVVTVDDKPLTYGKPAFKNPHFIARSKAAR